MLTLFTTAKPFRGLYNVQQRNAIQSWTLLKPRPEIILIDKADGSEEAAKEFGLRYVPEVERNEYGTPLVRSIFKIGRSLACNDILCYVNSDIILLSDFLPTIERVSEMICSGPFLLIGRRWEITQLDLLEFNPGWENSLRQRLSMERDMQSAAATDYFVFPKCVEWNIAPFAIGRSAWDGWFLYNALDRTVPVIDATKMISAVHQRHNYSHWADSNIYKSAEFKSNQQYRGSFRKQCTIFDSTYILTDNGLARPLWIRRITAEWLRINMIVAYYLRGVFHPYSYPLVVVLKSILGLFRFVRRAVQRVGIKVAGRR
jgi:hypothetical protein